MGLALSRCLNRVSEEEKRYENIVHRTMFFHYGG